jgi:hypothetical protein
MLPAASRRTSPLLVSNSTSPVSEITSSQRGRLCPIHHSHSGGHPTDVAASCRKRLRQTQWRKAFEEGSRHQRDVEYFHVRFTIGIGVNMQIAVAIIRNAKFVERRCVYPSFGPGAISSGDFFEVAEAQGLDHLRLDRRAVRVGLVGTKAIYRGADAKPITRAE